MHDVDVLGIALCGIASMIIGSLWYSQFLFGKKWMALLNVRPEDCKPKPGMWKTYLVSFIGALVMALVLERNFHHIDAPLTLLYALHIATALWLGFIAVSMMSEYLFTFIKKPWGLYFINAGYYLVLLIAYAFILYYI